MIPLHCPRCDNIWIYTGSGTRAKCSQCKYDIYFEKQGKIPINWDLTPQSFLLHDQRYYPGQAYFLIDIWNCSARISLMIISEDGNGMKSLSIPEIEEITEEMLETAINDVGGFINMSGHYPISEEIKTILQTFF
jgi:hypothetical protein